MKLNKDLLESWHNMETLDEYFRARDMFKDSVSSEDFSSAIQSYIVPLRKRITYCKKLLKFYDDPIIYYMLGELYDRYDMDESIEYLYKRPVRYYAIKAIRKNRKYAQAWVLLGKAYSFIAFLGGRDGESIENIMIEPLEKSVKKRSVYEFEEDLERIMNFINKAIYCICKAIKIDPYNERYQRILRAYHEQRNWDYSKILDGQ